jgi:capsular exopolysaccharide synthesis family protein
MSQDFQLAFNRPSTQIEPWAVGNQPTALGSPMPAQATPLHRIHRSMRGRYVLAVILALIGAAAGAAGGFLFGKPGYVSQGAIQIKPTIPNIEKMDSIVAMYDRLMTTEASKLMSQSVLDWAVKDPDWQKLVPPDPNGGDPTAMLASGLKADYVKMTEYITVAYQHRDPAIAQAGTRAVIRAYMKHGANEDAQQLETKLNFWKESRTKAIAATRAAQNTIEDLGRTFGTQDLRIVNDAIWHEVSNTESLLQQADMSLATVESPTGTTPDDMSLDDMAIVDPQIAKDMGLKRDIEAALEQAKLAGGGPNMARRKNLEQMLEIRTKMIEDRAKWFRERYKGWKFNNGAWVQPGSNNGVAGAPAGPTNPEALKEYRDRLKTVFEAQKKKATQVAECMQEINKNQEIIREMKDKEKEASDQIDKLQFQIDNLNRVTVLQEGNLPNDPVDNRTKLALVGFVGGGALPLGLLLMIGLLDTRYRYSDDATATEMQGVTLLGILPNLPDRLSDPEQAAIAAHCVHQIRTMLQINGGSAVDGSDRRVFAMTSASPGDGKTSLTLALGLSYAACGTRTLLIDCDLVGAGLSTRMNVHASEGVLEAIAHRSLLPYVRTTDIADVSILPVGSAHGYHASTLSPGALRRLIDEAKRNFDVILVDTGPILGSIEASLVTAAADGVVLAVSRGQSRPLVEKSLNHLNAIGARLAGVVFNRAQSNDFERSISGMSMRSVAAAGGKSNGRPVSASGEAVGPVARAVAPYARRSEEGAPDDGNVG